MAERVSDFALIVGHVWRCTACRDALLGNPSGMGIGYKLGESQRLCLARLSEDDFRTMMQLAAVTGLRVSELEEAVDHPRARLRHLGSTKGELRSGLSW